MYSPFALPSELLVAALLAQFPGRQAQIRALCALVGPRCPAPRNIVLYGLAATGKSAVVTAVLAALASEADEEADVEEIAPAPRLRYAVVRSAECITGRHLLERAVAAVAETVGWSGVLGRCENLAQLGVLLGKLLEAREGEEGRFVLVFDGVDAQRDAPPTLLPALARMGEVIPNLTTLFIVTSPRPHFLHSPGAPHIHFPAYTKPEALAILARCVPPIYPPTPPTCTSTSTSQPTSSPANDTDEPPTHLRPTPRETADLYTRFLSAAWDTFAKHSGRDILSLRHLAASVWPRFTAPIRAGLYSPAEFPKLLLAQRALFRDEAPLVPSIVSPAFSSPYTTLPHPSSTTTATTTLAPPQPPPTTTSLPYTPRLLLTAAYLASHTPARLDSTLFSKASAHAKKRRRGAGTQAKKARPGVERRRKISRALLGPQAFVLERLLAVFWALAGEAQAPGRGRAGGKVEGGQADVLAAVATLASLRLLVKTSAAADVLEGGGKWKVNVGWEVARGVGRSVGVEVEEWILE